MSKLDDLRKDCTSCTKCELFRNRTNPVFGQGDEDADVMLVGEGPGQKEDETGEPFVGRSGHLLTLYLNAMGIERDDVYIANIVKCRPPNNRDPSPDERRACVGWLHEQIKLVDPRIIVCLGRIAAATLIGPDFSVTREHGELKMIADRTYMGTFHPAALLRDTNKKGAALGDFVALRKFIEAIRG